MAGAGAKKFPAFSKLASADVNDYLADQVIMRFATTTARDAAFGGVGEPTLAEGMTAYIDADNSLYIYDGSNWLKTTTAGDRDKIGLWRITPTSVSGTGATIVGSDVVVSSGGTDFTINGIFSASYKSYKVIISNFTSVSATDLAISFGTAKTGTSHRWAQVICNTSGTVFGQGNAGANSMQFAVSRGSTTAVAANIEIISPFETIETSVTASSVDAGTDGIYRSTIGYHNEDVSITSLFVSTTGANFVTCRVAIYGYN
jgi:hypothetical protein